MIFPDRREAGRQRAARLADYRGRNPIVVALPRGGIPVAYDEIARALDAPVNVLVARKLGAPKYPKVSARSDSRGSMR